MNDRIECTDIVRKHEEMLIKNKIAIEEFIQRYDRDRSECAQRYREDREEARGWRERFDTKLASIEGFVSTIRPNYKLIMYVFGAAIVSMAAIIFRLMWTHVIPRY